MSEIQTVKTAIHEIAHAKLHAVTPDEKAAPEDKKDRHTKDCLLYTSPDTSFDCSGFVSYVLTNSGLVNTGRLGAQGLYNCLLYTSRCV